MKFACEIHPQAILVFAWHKWPRAFELCFANLDLWPTLHLSSCSGASLETAAGSGSGRFWIRPPSIGWLPGQLLERGICSSRLLECLRSSCSTASPLPHPDHWRAEKGAPSASFLYAHMPERVSPLVTSYRLRCLPPGEQDREGFRALSFGAQKPPLSFGG